MLLNILYFVFVERGLARGNDWCWLYWLVMTTELWLWVPRPPVLWQYVSTNLVSASSNYGDSWEHWEPGGTWPDNCQLLLFIISVLSRTFHCWPEEQVSNGIWTIKQTKSSPTPHNIITATRFTDHHHHWSISVPSLCLVTGVSGVIMFSTEID